MTGTTITTTISHSVTLNSTYSSPLTIANNGGIMTGLYGGRALYVDQNAALVTIVNHGRIVPGGAQYDGGRSGYAGLTGYVGVDLDSATTLNNTGIIFGGYGGSGSQTAGAGGIGVDVRATSTIANSGTIYGGAGGYGSNYNGIGLPGSGGDGVDLAVAAILMNSGDIAGGVGGSAYTINQYGYGIGGTGVSASAEGIVNNTGFISGGDGSSPDHASAYSDSGGTGVALNAGSTLTNAGYISGGIANAGLGDHLANKGGHGGTGVYLIASSGSNSKLIAGGYGFAGVSYGGSGGFGAVFAQYSSFSNSGRVTGGSGGGATDLRAGAGGIGMVIESYATVTNTGSVSGGGGGSCVAAGAVGGDGGEGIYLTGGVFTNRGTVIAGNGGAASGDGGNQSDASTTFSGVGGTGIYEGSFFGGNRELSVANYGLVRGGNGASITGEGGVAGAGGYGAFILGGSFVNHGRIIGGAGGYTGQAAYGYGTGGTGGIGLEVFSGMTATNAGTIIGGVGGANIYAGAAGGAGVVIYGATFIDSGAVRGGAGGNSQVPGAAGDAVYFKGTAAGTLVLDPGASFSGLVTGNGSVANVLELAGTSTATLSGIGTEFTDFRAISFASGAQRIAEGSVSAFPYVVGFAPHDAIVLDGYTDSPSSSSVSLGAIKLVNSSATNIISLSGSTAKDVIIAEGGGKTTITAAVGTLAHTIGSGTEQFVLFGGLATGSKITAGGVEQVENAGTSAAGTISGGTLLLDIGAHLTGGVGFSTVTGGKLIIDSVTMPTATISGFIAGDTIQLAGVAYNLNDKVTVATAGTLTIVAPGTSYKLDIAGATVGETDFKFASGSILTKTAAPKAMAFLSPEAALFAPGHAPAFAASDDLGLAGFTYNLPFATGGDQSFALLPHPDPMLIHGVGYGAFTISDNVRLEMGLIQHANHLL